MFSVFTNNHQDTTPDKLFSKSVNSKNSNNLFAEMMIAQVISKILVSSEVDKCPIRMEFTDTAKETTEISNTTQSKS